MSFIFNACFEPNVQTEIVGTSEIIREDDPHQRLYRQEPKKIQKKVTDRIPNKLAVRGGWRRKNEEVDYNTLGHKEDEYESFLKEKRKNM